jgi:T4-like virus tail tube protein gp19
MKASSASSKRPRTSPKPPTVAQAELPFTNLRFAVGIEGLDSTRAVEVVFPTARIVSLPRKRRAVQFDTLVIRRGLTRSTEWYDWWNEARRPTRAVPRRWVTVVLQNADGAEGMRWLFPDSVPVNYSLSPLNALVGAAVIESLELSVGGFEVDRPHSSRHGS